MKKLKIEIIVPDDFTITHLVDVLSWLTTYSYLTENGEKYIHGDDFKLVGDDTIIISD